MKNVLATFERKILRTIFGLVKEHDPLRIRINYELCELYKELDVVKYIKKNRLKRVACPVRMDHNKITRILFISRGK